MAIVPRSSQQKEHGGSNGHPQHDDGMVTIAIAAIALKGRRGQARLAQWLKLYEVEEDVFYAVKPFFVVLKDQEVLDSLKKKFDDMVDDMRRQGFGYVGIPNHENSGEGPTEKNAS